MIDQCVESVVSCCMCFPQRQHACVLIGCIWCKARCRLGPRRVMTMAGLVGSGVWLSRRWLPDSRQCRAFRGPSSWSICSWASHLESFSLSMLDCTPEVVFTWSWGQWTHVNPWFQNWNQTAQPIFPWGPHWGDSSMCIPGIHACSVWPSEPFRTQSLDYEHTNFLRT